MVNPKKKTAFLKMKAFRAVWQFLESCAVTAKVLWGVATLKIKVAVALGVVFAFDAFGAWAGWLTIGALVALLAVFILMVVRWVDNIATLTGWDGDGNDSKEEKISPKD